MAKKNTPTVDTPTETTVTASIGTDQSPVVLQFEFGQEQYNGCSRVFGSPNRLNILKKLAAIQSQMAYVQKDKQNLNHKYKYASERAIKEKLHELLVQYGVYLQFSFSDVKNYALDESKVPSDRRPTFATGLCGIYVFHDIDTGEYIGGTTYGTGSGRDEKGAYAAMTGMIKYTITSNFLTATGDDPENDDDDGGKGKGAPNAPKTSSVAGAKGTSTPPPSNPPSEQAPQETTPAPTMIKLSADQRQKLMQIEEQLYPAQPAQINARKKYLGTPDLHAELDKNKLLAYHKHMAEEIEKKKAAA